MLDLMFIFGTVGLVGMVAGPSYAAYMIKQHKYREAFVNGLTITIVCFAFFLAVIIKRGVA